MWHDKMMIIQMMICWWVIIVTNHIGCYHNKNSIVVVDGAAAVTDEKNEYMVGIDGSIVSSMQSTQQLPFENDIDSFQNQSNFTDFLYYDNYHQYGYPKDPNMRIMTNYSFEAYVRPPVSSYYVLDAIDKKTKKQRKVKKPSFKGFAAKFINMSPERTTLYWVDVNHDNTPSIIDHEILPWAAGGTASYVSHQFIMTHYENPTKIICTFTVVTKISVYYCNPYELSESIQSNNNSNIMNTEPYQYSRRGIVTKGYERDYKALSNHDKEKYYKAHIHNLRFGDEYQKFTKGTPWLGMYPPNPLLHPILAADYIGQTHIIISNESHFHTIPPMPSKSYFSPWTGTTLTQEQMKHPPVADLALYRNEGPLKLQVKALSCLPKVFEIPNFLSNTEVDHILDMVKQKTLTRSQTGDGQFSDTRTSRTAWIGRPTDYIINAIYRRVAHVVNITEALLRPHTSDEVNVNHDPQYPTIQFTKTISEDIQIVHYDPHQEYSSHHDFEYATGVSPDDKHSRTLNVAMYLNDVPSPGGETSFPRWRNSETSEALKVTPTKGKAVLFYMVYPDGNLDDLSQHAGMPVITGEKYFANLWLHTYH